MIEIDGRRLGLAEIAAVAIDGEKVTLAPSVTERLAASQRSARATAQSRPVYGRSTGVGANRSVSLESSDAEVDMHGLNLLRSHAVDAGHALDRETVRAMLVVRASQLAAGASGINPALVAAVVQMLNADALPEVREFGGIGTADLPALAGTALTLLGERPTMDGTRVPVVVESWPTEDALPFISSSALTIAQAVLAHHRLTTLMANLTTISALSFTAMSGNPEAFGPEVARASESDSMAEVAATLQELVVGHGKPARIQDPYCLRMLPHSLGSVAEDLDALGITLERLAVAGHENPMVFGSVEDHTNGVAHHGLFHMSTLARRIDALQVALGAACTNTLGRITRLCDPAFTGLHRFLAGNDAGQSGVMMLEYVAAAAVGRIRANAQPVSLQTVNLSLGAEEDASFATLGAAQLESSAHALATVVAVELVCASRALRGQGRQPDEFASPRLRAMMEAGFTLPSDVQDRDLRGDLERAQQLVSAPY